MTPNKADLIEQKAQLISYLHSKIKADDFHAVQDAASDIREIDAKLSMLTDDVVALRAGEPFTKAGEIVRCPLGHLMRWNIEDDRFYCQCGARASKHGTIIVDPDPVDVNHG